MIGVLLVNLGTPRSPSYWSVFRYLNEFLTDGRVVDIPWALRQLLVRGVIIPKRCGNSAKSYQAIWTDEGSPLLSYGLKVERLLQEKLGADYKVALAMRYQSHSIKEVINQFKGVKQLIVLPLFPQYASATTGSVHQEVMKQLSKWDLIPEVRLIDSYPTNPKMIETFALRGKNWRDYDHVLISFHGLPERQLKKNGCPVDNQCCKQNRNHCYRANCHATARAIAEKLQMKEYSITYQSRLGKEPWLEPFTSDVLEQLAKQGKKKVLVFCPSFVTDCLETIFEIKTEYREDFIAAGGEKLDLVESLNDHPLWIDALAEIVADRRSVELVGVGV